MNIGDILTKTTDLAKHVIATQATLYDTSKIVQEQYESDVAEGVLRTSLISANDVNLDPKTLENFSVQEAKITKITISDFCSLSLAHDFIKENDDKIAVLNSADPYTPGGSGIRTTDTPEGVLCKCSILYPILSSQRCNVMYYDRSTHPMGNPDVMYHEHVLVFRDDVTYAQVDPYTIDVMSCAPIDLNEFSGEATTLREEIRKRWNAILYAACSHDMKNIILGAFGCDICKNPPYMVAEELYKAIQQYENWFDNIIIPVTEETREDFAKVFFPEEATDNEKIMVGIYYV